MQKQRIFFTWFHLVCSVDIVKGFLFSFLLFFPLLSWYLPVFRAPCHPHLFFPGSLQFHKLSFGACVYTTGSSSTSHCIMFYFVCAHYHHLLLWLLFLLFCFLFLQNHMYSLSQIPCYIPLLCPTWAKNFFLFFSRFDWRRKEAHNHWNVLQGKSKVCVAMVVVVVLVVRICRHLHMLALKIYTI